MHDALLMRGRERQSDLPGDVERVAERERARIQPGAQGIAVDQLHRDERRAVRLVDLVNRHDVGMIEGRSGAPRS